MLRADALEITKRASLPKKWRPKYPGPLRVAQVMGPVTCRIELPSAMKRAQNVFHVLKLKRRVTPRNGPGPIDVVIDGKSTTEQEFFIDVLAEQIEGEEPGATNPNTLFADDVKLAAETPEVLQTILDVATKWADQNGMTWNTGKSWVLRTQATEEHSFFLAGSQIGLAEEVEYLGVTINYTGIAGTKTATRIRTAKDMIASLRTLGAFDRGIHPARSIRSYKSLVQSRWEYAAHLTPRDSELDEAISSRKTVLRSIVQ